MGSVGPAYASNGSAWGDFTGTIFAVPVVYKVVGRTWYIECTEYWFDSTHPPTMLPPRVDEPTMISEVSGKMVFVSDTTAHMVFHGKVKYATDVGLVGRKVLFLGTFTWDPKLVFVIEATLWIMPNK